MDGPLIETVMLMKSFFVSPIFFYLLFQYKRIATTVVVMVLLVLARLRRFFMFVPSSILIQGINKP